MTTTARDPLQRHVVRTLVGSQMIGGVGLAAGIAVGALIAEEVSGSARWAGLGSTFQVLGTAVVAVPVVRVMAARGRRAGLVLAYLVAALGAVGIIVAAVVGSFTLLLAASLLFGGATTANNQARYAATDLAPPDRRARDLALVVWATTVGSVLGPNLATPGEPVARALGLPVLAGPFVFSVAGLLLAAGLLVLRLRPDPLLEARRRHVESGGVASAVSGSMLHGLRVVAAIPDARLGLLTLVLGHATMVSIMVMTPLHMAHGAADLEVIGFVISMHILGMFAFSPLTGIAVDRFGGRAVALAGSVVLSSATVLASVSPEGHSPTLLAGLFLLGLGWSCTLVSGSALLTGAVPVAERPSAQGSSDLVMSLVAAGGGALAGVVVEASGYRALSLGALAVAVVIGLAAALARPRTGQPA
ncbi:MFS transporter [Oryzobacter sp. R7]|uniref:MFS transporter n=1 Tax=Oryzobacter faecalis TaxID=3388656 RepID=UPI00398C9B23